MTKLRLMSNNLWWCTTNTEAWQAMGADCSNEVRAPGFARVYAELQPDIVGMQECPARMYPHIFTVLAEQNAPYAVLWGKDTPILYRKDKFELVDSHVLIYPEEVPGLDGCFNNLKTKSYAVAALRLKETGEMIVFGTTHLMYRSGNPASPSYLPGVDQARAWQLGQMIDKAEEYQKKYNCPAVLVGDLNTWPGTPALNEAAERGFLNAHDIATDYAEEISGMHKCDQNGYDTEPGKGGFAYSIDHILVKGDVTVRRFERFHEDYYMPLSDHFPSYVDVEL